MEKPVSHVFFFLFLLSVSFTKKKACWDQKITERLSCFIIGYYNEHLPRSYYVWNSLETVTFICLDGTIKNNLGLICAHVTEHLHTSINIHANNFIVIEPPNLDIRWGHLKICSPNLVVIQPNPPPLSLQMDVSSVKFYMCYWKLFPGMW